MLSNELFEVYLLKNLKKNLFSVFLISKLYYLIVPLKYLNNFNFYKFSKIKVVYLNKQIYIYNSIKFILYYWSLSSYLIYKRMNFTGKGYRLNITSPTRNTITFNFGHSHLYYIYILNLKPLKESKTKIIFFGLNTFIFNKPLTKLYESKPLNIFTWRGLRFKKDILRKKTGKVSLYF